MTNALPFHPLLEPIRALHRHIRNDVVRACEVAAVGTLSGVATEAEGDTIYAIDRIAEHELVAEISRTIATPEQPVLLAAEGLLPSSKGAAVRFDDAEKRTVLDGPFAEAKEMIAGYWLLQTSSLDECVEWVKRAPIQGVTIQIRQIAEADDLGPDFTPELREAEQQLRSSLG